ncbi:MAG: prolyl oligopeptidase family serine peptidase [Hyphomonas sp.]
MGLGNLLASAGLAAILVMPVAAETPGEIADLFGRAAAIADPQLSPDGSKLAVECSPAAVRTICVFDLTGGSDAVVVPQIQDVRLVSHYWANNDTLILNVETFQTLQTGSGLRDYTFERAVAFNVGDQKPVMLLRDNRAWIDINNLAAIEPSKTDKALFSIVSTEEDGHNSERRGTKVAPKIVYNLMEVDLKTGRSKIKEKATQNVVDAVLTPEGDIVAEIRYRDRGSLGHEVEIVAGGKTIFERDRLDYNPISVWGLDSSRQNLLVFISEGDAYGLQRMSLGDGTLTPIDSRGGLVGPVIDPRMLDVVGFEYPDDLTVQVLEDPKLKDQVNAIAGAFPDASVTAESWSDDRTQSVIRIESPGKPADFYLFESASGALSPVGNVAPHLDGRVLGTVEPVSYAARDGMEIHGYLTLPPGKTRADGPFPMILLPHGGPETRDTLSFDWWAQAYAAAGYAVLQPNFRGSAGFGTDFRNAGYGEFGGKMVLDVIDGANWAVEQGVATEGNLCVAGASYGGYSALMVPLLQPGVVKCVIAVNAVTNPFAIAAEGGNDSFYANYIERYLGADRFTDAAQRRQITPSERAAEYKVPVMIIASEEDSTVPFDQSDGLRRAIGDATQLDFVRIEGEDHYLRSSRGRYDVLLNSLEFLSRNLPAD